MPSSPRLGWLASRSPRTTTAPAPSPKSNAVSPFCGSSERDFTSAATTRHVLACPLRIIASAMDRPYRNPEHDAATSKAGTLGQPNFHWRWQAVEGKGMSGEVVDNTMASTSDTDNPAASRACCAAPTARSEEACEGSAQCLFCIPVSCGTVFGSIPDAVATS